MSVTSIDIAISSLWAKKSDTNGNLMWLPLSVHLSDTMNVASWLWNHWVCEGQRRNIISDMENGSEELAEATIAFLAAIHDLGKATPAFQTQKGYSSSEDLDQQLLERLERYGFTGICEIAERFQKLHAQTQTTHAIAGEVILHRMGVLDDISSIIGAHHGMPADSVEIYRNQEAYLENYYQSENPKSDIYQIWKSVQEQIVQQALEESGICSISNLPKLTMPDQVQLCGLVIVADWIVSNENFFPLIPIDQETVPDLQERFLVGIKKWYQTIPFEVHLPENADLLYEKRFGFHPREFQRIIFDTVQMIDKPGLVIIEAPTGGGKTESALACAEQLAAKSGRSGLFFGLPTQATSNSMFSRVYEWLTGVSNEYETTTSLRLQHGKAYLNELMQKLSSNMANDESYESQVQVNQWFAGRKTSALDDYVVGTIDNFLLAALKQKHLMLRHLGFDKKVVILDEIHAYDAYMSQYLSEALSWMGTYGVPVILLSATLPKAKRAEFVQSYLKGAGLKKREIDLNGANLDTDAYPLLTYTDGNAVRQTTEFPAERPKKVSIKTCSEEDLFQLIGELIQSGGILGIIVNTVRRAQDITAECKKLFPNIPVELLHANFIATDRIEKENHLTQMIGKDAVRPERAIIIGTQVIEQSLDIDFDVLITDLCPVDLLLQRIGRLHRHDIKRPKEHQTPTTYVLGKNADMKFEHGSELIYGACLLARTQYFLRDEIRIPDDVSPLVQKVYDISNVTMNLPPGLNAQYCKWEDDFINQEMNQKQKAEAYRIDNPRTRICPEKNNLIGWLNTPDVSATDEESYAKVRDIDETIEVIAVRRCGEGYCLFSDNFNDAHDISSSINDPLIAKKIATQSLRISSGMIRMAGGFSHVIRLLEDYNRRNLPVWQTQPWLKGALGIIFDEKGEFQLVDDGPVLRYSSEYGLRVEKKEEYE